MTGDELWQHRLIIICRARLGQQVFSSYGQVGGREVDWMEMLAHWEDCSVANEALGEALPVRDRARSFLAYVRSEGTFKEAAHV